MEGDLGRSAARDSETGGDMKGRGAGMRLVAVWLGGTAMVCAADSHGCRQGYRRQSVIRDFTLGREWTIYASCAHPETPRVAIIADRSADESSAAVLHSPVSSQSIPATVHAGSRVRLWMSSPLARLELSAVALENGSVGETIRVRATQGRKVLSGTVRADDSVELGMGEGFRGAGR
jgi:Chaperone for flagella basal body P-ring formation